MEGITIPNNLFVLSLLTGEGAPDYAALYMNRTIKPLPFPIPIPSLTAYKVDPKTGYVGECAVIPHS